VAQRRQSHLLKPPPGKRYVNTDHANKILLFIGDRIFMHLVHSFTFAPSLMDLFIHSRILPRTSLVLCRIMTVTTTQYFGNPSLGRILRRRFSSGGSLLCLISRTYSDTMRSIARHSAMPRHIPLLFASRHSLLFTFVKKLSQRITMLLRRLGRHENPRAAVS
jgi:hypothetical protein